MIKIKLKLTSPTNIIYFVSTNSMRMKHCKQCITNAIQKTLFSLNNILNFKKNHLAFQAMCKRTTLDIRFHPLQFESILNFPDATRLEYEVSSFCCFTSGISIYVESYIFCRIIFNKSISLIYFNNNIT